MPRVGQLRLGRAAPALCGAPAAFFPPRAAPGGHSRPAWSPAAPRCTTPPHPSLEMGRPLSERSRRPRSAGLQSQGCWTFATGSSQRRASTRPPHRGSTPLLRASQNALVLRWHVRLHRLHSLGRASGGASGGRIWRHSARAGGARVILEPSVRAGGPNRPARGSCSPHALAPGIRGQQHAAAAAARDRGRAPRAREPRGLGRGGKCEWGRGDRRQEVVWYLLPVRPPTTHTHCPDLVHCLIVHARAARTCVNNAASMPPDQRVSSWSDQLPVPASSASCCVRASATSRGGRTLPRMRSGSARSSTTTTSSSTSRCSSPTRPIVGSATGSTCPFRTGTWMLTRTELCVVALGRVGLHRGANPCDSDSAAQHSTTTPTRTKGRVSR